MGCPTSFSSAWGLSLALGWARSILLNPTAAPPTQGPVITTRGLTQPFLPLLTSSSWKSSTPAGPAPTGPGGRESTAPPPRLSGDEGGAGREGPPGCSQLPRAPPAQEPGALGGRWDRRDQEAGDRSGSRGSPGKGGDSLGGIYEGRPREETRSLERARPPLHPPHPHPHPIPRKPPPSQPGVQPARLCDPSQPRDWVRFFLDCFLFPSSPGLLPAAALPPLLCTPFGEL